MDILITAIHCTVSQDVKEYARKKVAKLDKYFNKTKKTDVTIHAEPGRYEVELICSAGGGHVFTAQVSSKESIEESIDLCVDKMAKQLRRFKDRVRSHKGKNNRKKLVRDIKRMTARLNQLLETEAEDNGEEEDYDEE